MPQFYIIVLITALIVIGIFSFILFKARHEKEHENALQRQDIVSSAADPPDEEIRKAFTASARSFSGCYEPLFLAYSEQNTHLMQKILMQWNRLVQPIPLLHSVFTQYVKDVLKEDAKEADIYKAAEGWLHQLSKLGISHMQQGEVITMTEDTMLYYQLNEPYETGDDARVVRPCWTLDNGSDFIVIEQGTAILITENIQEGGSEDA